MSGKLGVLSLTIQTVLANIKLIIGAFQAAMNGDWYRFGEMLRMVWDNSWRMIGIILSTAWTNIKTSIATMATNVINYFKGVNWGDVGTNIVKGIANGLTNSVSWIINAATQAAKAALAAAKGFLGIHSPSTVAEAEVGKPTGQGQGLGWMKGLMGMLPQIQQTVGGMISGVANGAVGGMQLAPTMAVSGISQAGGSKSGSYHVTVENRPLISLGDRYEAEQVLKPIVFGWLRELGVEVNR
jgi:hypothetical protein